MKLNRLCLIDNQKCEYSIENKDCAYFDDTESTKVIYIDETFK